MTDPSTRRQGLELGAVNFVTKPIEPELLQLRVNNQLRHVEQHKQLQTDYDDLLALASLRDDIEQFARDDLKAPLVSILGLVRALLEDGNLLRGQQGVLRLLEQNSHQLLNMLTLSGELCEVANEGQHDDREDGLRHFSQLDSLLQHCDEAAAIGSRVSVAV